MSAKKKQTSGKTEVRSSGSVAPRTTSFLSFLSPLEDLRDLCFL